MEGPHLDKHSIMHKVFGVLDNFCHFCEVLLLMPYHIYSNDTLVFSYKLMCISSWPAFLWTVLGNGCKRQECYSCHYSLTTRNLCQNVILETSSPSNGSLRGVLNTTRKTTYSRSTGTLRGVLNTTRRKTQYFSGSAY